MRQVTLSELYLGSRRQTITALRVLAGSVAALAFACAAPPASAGFVEGRAAYTAKDFQLAHEEFRKAADQGHSGAEYFLGEMYRRGRGVERNRVEAVRWYRKAAEQRSRCRRSSRSASCIAEGTAWKRTLRRAHGGI